MSNFKKIDSAFADGSEVVLLSYTVTPQLDSALD
jgi:hypothetical protein